MSAAHTPPERAGDSSALAARFTPAVAALLLLALVALHGWHWRGANYRDDEIRTTHAGMTLSAVEVVRWMGVDIHPPLWRLSATGWVSLFGVDEAVTRWLASLYVVLAGAALYRLAADLFDRHTALLALLVFGTHALVMFYGRELRPYAALLMWTILAQWTLLGWCRAVVAERQAEIRHNSPRRITTAAGLWALAWVVCASCALYTHFVAGFVVVGAAAAVLLAVRLSRAHVLRLVGLLALVGLAFTGWLLSLAHGVLVTKPGGVDYGIQSDTLYGLLAAAYVALGVRPLALGNLLIGVGLLTPLVAALRPLAALGSVRRRTAADTVYRWGAAGRVLWVALAAGVGFALMLATQTQLDILTRRNLVVFVPALALLAAAGLRTLTWQPRLIALVLLVQPALFDFVRYERAQPYREVADAIVPGYAPGTPVILSVDDGTGFYFAFAYYLMDRLPGALTQDDMLYLTLGEPRVNLPEPPTAIVTDDGQRARLETLVEDASRVWWVTSGHEPPHAQVYRLALEQRFTATRVVHIPQGAYATDYTVTLYQRVAAEPVMLVRR